jgi:hypothetical protein
VVLRLLVGPPLRMTVAAVVAAAAAVVVAAAGLASASAEAAGASLVVAAVVHLGPSWRLRYSPETPAAWSQRTAWTPE